MAVSRRTSGTGGAVGSGNATVTLTPAANDAWFAFLVESAANLSSQPALSDNNADSAVWTQIAQVTIGTSYRATLFGRSKQFQNTTSTIVTASQPVANFGCFLDVIAMSGLTVAGQAAIRKVGSTYQQATGSSAASSAPSTTFGAAPLTTNFLLAFAGAPTNPPGLTAPTSFTRNQDAGNATPVGLDEATVASGVTATTITWGTSIANWLAITVEFDPTVSGTANGSPLSPAGTVAPFGSNDAVSFTAFRGFTGLLASAEESMFCFEVKQSTAVTIPIVMRSSNTGNGVAGLAAQITSELKKPGGGYSTISPTITDRGGGSYDVSLTTSHTDTLSINQLRFSVANAIAHDPIQTKDNVFLKVVKVDPEDGVHFGISSLPNAAAGANTGLPVVGTQIPNANANTNGGLPTQGGAIPNANAGANTGLPVVGTQIPNATAGANNGLPVQGGAVPNAAAGANNGLPVQGGAIPNANAGAVGGLSKITAVGQGPGGVEKPFSMIDKCVYSSGKLTSARLRIFANSTALAAATPGNTDGTDGEVERYVMTDAYNGDGTLNHSSWDKVL